MLHHPAINLSAQTVVKKGEKYDTIIRKRVDKPVAKPPVKAELVLPTPEFINQPYYYDKDDAKGKLMNFSVKMPSKDNYQIQFPEQLEAGEDGFVWAKNMELKEFTVFAFGVDWKSSD